MIYLTNPQHYYNVIQHQKHVVLNIRTNNCAPCKRGVPLFVELSRKHPNLTFAVLEIEKSYGKEFIEEVLQLNAVPTFDVYTDGYRVFRTTSPKNFHQLEEFVEDNLP